jgi:hypothetical protein
MSNVIQNRLGLTAGQTVFLGFVGAALWLLAAIILRTIAPMGALEGTARFLTYALVIPGTLPFVFMTRALVGLRPDQTAIGIAVVTATALLIDGIVVAWYPKVYGGEPAQVKACAAAILWGAGVGMALSFVFNKEKQT